jgi:hypothetical protein
MYRHSSLLAAALAAAALAGVTVPSALAAPARHAHVMHHARHAQHAKRPQAKHRPSKPLPCNATMTNANPYRFTTTNLRVRTTHGAMVQAVAHYFSTAVSEAAVAGRLGVAAIPYYISTGLPWYRVSVTIVVSQGNRTGACVTSFVPRLF